MSHTPENGNGDPLIDDDDEWLEDQEIEEALYDQEIAEAMEDEDEDE